MTVVSNTTVISNFASVGCLAMLRKLFGIIHITSQVFDEIQFGLLDGYSFYSSINLMIHPFADNGWIYMTSLNSSSELKTFDKMLEKLHSGEASCLSVALHRKWIFLSDDKAARTAAVKSDVAISGTLGILLSLVKRKISSSDEADSILQQMIKNGYYSPVQSLNEILL